MSTSNFYALRCSILHAATEEISDEVENWLNEVSNNNEITDRLKLLIKIEDSSFMPKPGIGFG